jgi:sorting nexin-4
MEYVTGDRFSPDFTLRRASSLNRFLSRLALHPVLRRSALLIIFLESQDWNATMRSRPSRSGSGASDGGGASGVLDNITETFMNAFTKVHKPDKRFIEVRERADKLDEDLSHIEKIVSRVSRREDELQKDISELGENFKRLINLESGVEAAVQSFTASLAEEAGG